MKVAVEIRFYQCLCKSIASFTFFLIALLFCSEVFAQNTSEQLFEHISDRLNEIDNNLINSEYDQALSKIQNLENYEKFISIKENKLNLELKKARAYYGMGDQKKAVETLLSGFDKLKLRPYSLRIDYSLELGEIFKQAKNYSKAIDYFKISLEDSKKNRDTLNLLKSYRKHKLDVL